MVSVKGKANMIGNRGTSHHGTSKSVGVRNFKVYDENDKGKVQDRDSVYPESKMKTVLVNKGITQINANDSKGCLKNLDKSKGKHDTSMKPNVGRRVLADVSNVYGNFPNNEVHDGSKPVKGKSERIAPLQRVSVGSGIRIGSSTSSKTYMGPVRANPRQAVGHSKTLQRVGIKDLKVSSGGQCTNGQVYESVDTDGRKIARNALPQTRKSLPVLKRVHQMDTTGRKENDGNSVTGKGKYGFPVKPKVGRKVVPQASNGRSQLRSNRVSDGFILMTSKGQSKETLSGKSVKPFVKTAVIVSNTRRTSKTKLVSGLNKTKEEAKTKASSLSGNTELIVPHEQPEQRGLPSDSKSNMVADATNIISRRKSARRKSYTSLLISGPKILEDHYEAMNQDSLPNVYDDGNHLEVAEYVDDIYQYYWVMEAQNNSLANYMAIQTGMTPQMRGILINWLIEVHLKFDLMQETLYLAVTLLDRYLSVAVIKKTEMQLVGITALLLASKYEDFWHPRVRDLISISAEPYTRDQVLVMEKSILKKLKFRLNAPTAYVFMLRFLKAAQSDAKLEHLAFYLIELCLVEYEALKFKPSLLCASAIYVARLTLQMIPTWTPLLRKNTRYEESQIRACAEMILRFHKAAGTAMLKVTYEKYKGLDHSGVTAVEPLDRLPL